jgi:hypothetical protein
MSHQMPYQGGRPGSFQPSPVTGLPLVVMAGHSAFLSFDGPAQVTFRNRYGLRRAWSRGAD